MKNLNSELIQSLYFNCDGIKLNKTVAVRGIGVAREIRRSSTLSGVSVIVDGGRVVDWDSIDDENKKQIYNSRI